MFLRFVILLSILVPVALPARYHCSRKPPESKVDCSAPCITYCPKVNYVKHTRRVPQKICVAEERTCRRQEWQKIKYKQLVCKMVPQYSYQECYKYVPRYVDVPSMKMVSKTVFNDEEYYVPEYTYEKCTQEASCEPCSS